LTIGVRANPPLCPDACDAAKNICPSIRAISVADFNPFTLFIPLLFLQAGLSS
jgi:hypothetical protein